MQGIGADADSGTFKAIPLNKKIFERPSRLPTVNKKGKTGFEEFSLSQTNRKSTLVSKDEIKADFKALPLNAKILQEQSFKPSLNPEDRQIESKPFSFKTDERLKNKKKVDEEEQVTFKAREKPNYKFFEPKKE